MLYVLPVFALGFGGSIPVRPAFQAEYFGLKAFGAIQGLAFTIATLGGLLGPVFAGWMYDVTESYRLAFVPSPRGPFWRCRSCSRFKAPSQWTRVPSYRDALA